MSKRNLKNIPVNFYYPTDNKNMEIPKKLVEIFAKRILEEYERKQWQTN